MLLVQVLMIAYNIPVIIQMIQSRSHLLFIQMPP